MNVFASVRSDIRQTKKQLYTNATLHRFHTANTDTEKRNQDQTETTPQTRRPTDPPTAARHRHTYRRQSASSLRGPTVFNTAARIGKQTRSLNDPHNPTHSHATTKSTMAQRAVKIDEVSTHQTFPQAPQRPVARCIYPRTRVFGEFLCARIHVVVVAVVSFGARFEFWLTDSASAQTTLDGRGQRPRLRCPGTRLCYGFVGLLVVGGKRLQLHCCVTYSCKVPASDPLCFESANMASDGQTIRTYTHRHTAKVIRRRAHPNTHSWGCAV